MKKIMLSTSILLLGATGTIAVGPANTDPAAVAAGNYAVEPSHTRIQFSVAHMGFTYWNGDFTGTSGSLTLDPKTLAASKVDVSVPVASVSTTNAKLDGELKSADWLDAAQFPTIRFVSARATRIAANKATIAGTLTIHGITKHVVLAAVFNGAGINPMDKKYTVGFDATTTVKRSDFGVTKLSGLVGDVVTLHISAAFEKVN